MVLRISSAHRRTTAEKGALSNRATPSRGDKGGAAGTETAAPPPAPPAPPEAPVAPPPGPPPSEWRPPRRPGGAVIGIVLVAIGLAALAGQIVPGLAWWRLWPLVIVGAGIVQAFTPGYRGWSVDRMFEGFVTAAFGMVILAITTGVVSVAVFWQLLTLWPVLLIAIGLDLLGKAVHLSWVRALGSIAVIGALAYAVAVNAGSVAPLTLGSASAGENSSISEPVGNVRQAELQLNAGVANVTLSGGSDLVRARATSPWGEPAFSVNRSGSKAKVRLSLGEGNHVAWPGQANAELDAALAESVLWDMKVNTGVSSLDGDLSQVPVRSLELKPGVADCEVKLGAVPMGVAESQVIVKSGVSSVTLKLPAGTPARLESKSGLTGHDIDAAFRRTGDGTWETSSYRSARDAGAGVWVISVKSGIGSITVDTY